MEHLDLTLWNFVFWCLNSFFLVFKTILNRKRKWGLPVQHYLSLTYIQSSFNFFWTFRWIGIQSYTVNPLPTLINRLRLIICNRTHRSNDYTIHIQHYFSITKNHVNAIINFGIFIFNHITKFFVTTHKRYVYIILKTLFKLNISWHI